MKYPRTYHLPWSPGTTSDDKKLSGDWFKYYKDKEIVISEKLDGESTFFNKTDVYARSHSSPTRSPWSINLWDPSKGFYWTIRDLIGEDEGLYGENLYGIHSIEYNKLPNYWHMFAINDGKRWYSWDELNEFSNMIVTSNWSLEGQLVPELFRGVISSEDELKSIIDGLMKEPSRYGDTKEGVVIRIADSFPIDEFKNNVCKYVRANHVQTNIHWTRNWKPAKLIQNVKN